MRTEGGFDKEDQFQHSYLQDLMTSNLHLFRSEEHLSSALLSEDYVQT